MSEVETSKRIAITGGTGFLGRALSEALRTEGWSVAAITRRPSGPLDIPWDPEAGVLPRDGLEGFDVVVHLAGESIASVWTAARKRRIMESRARGTRLLAETLAQLDRPPAVLVSASGVGYYGDAGDRELAEGAPPGDDFLATVCRAWEAAAEPAEDAGVRVVRTRFGLVLHPSGGVLQLALPVFKLGLGANFGDGKQWLSWIWRSDAVRAIIHAIESEEVAGPVNVTSPAPVRNSEFTRELARAVHRPVLLSVPTFALRTFTGGMADALLLVSQKAVPAALQRSGFVFEYPDLRAALAAGLD